MNVLFVAVVTVNVLLPIVADLLFQVTRLCRIITKMGRIYPLTLNEVLSLFNKQHLVHYCTFCVC